MGGTTDVDGNPRFVDTPRIDTGNGDPPIVDMGAYESSPKAPADFDFDYDGDVDVADLVRYEDCMAGPEIPQDLTACRNARLDGNTDAGLSDFSVFRRCVSGEGNPVDPSCAD